MEFLDPALCAGVTLATFTLSGYTHFSTEKLYRKTTWVEKMWELFLTDWIPMSVMQLHYFSDSSL